MRWGLFVCVPMWMCGPVQHKSLRGPRGAMIFFRKGVRSVDKKGNSAWRRVPCLSQASRVSVPPRRDHVRF
jgi:hypothetical protein